MPGDEYILVQRPFLDALVELGYIYVSPSDLDREREGERSVLLLPRLRDTVGRLNPGLAEDEVEIAYRHVALLLTSPTHPDLVEANAGVYEALVRGVPVQTKPDAPTKTVHLFDFENLDRNEFLVTDSVPDGSSFWVQGDQRIAPDIIVFVNGIPLVAVECKSPHLIDKDPIQEAQDHLQRYVETVPRLFYTNLFMVATCAQELRYAPLWNVRRGYPAFSPWYDDERTEALKSRLGRSPNPQEVFIDSVFPKEHLLDFLRFFVAFAVESGRAVKKIARSQQSRAVNAAVASAREASEEGENRGGTIWHWQGSGKSLTMVWLASKLRALFQNPAILLVTDRKDLDKQLDGVFRQHGYPNPYRAETISDLRQLLTPPTGKTILTTIQKLGARDSKIPILSEERQIFALCDEAHRSQYRVQAARMRELLPNAIFFALTGTPLEKEDRHTPAVFGGYVDRYTIRDAERDGAVVPIWYEPRVVKMKLEPGMDLDQMLLAYFQDLGLDEESCEDEKVSLEALRRLSLSHQTVAHLEERMKEISNDLVEHYLTQIEKNGFKAMVVTHRRGMAVRYKMLIDEVLQASGRQDIQTEVVITWQPNDPSWMRARCPKQSEDDIRERFKKADDPLKILCVSDKLLTGFDAPVLQVMYLDKRLREHNLLQAIARTNRPLPGKEYGLVVDCYGISEELEEALARYETTDIQGAYRDVNQAFDELREARDKAMDFFERLLDGIPSGIRLDPEVEERCLEILADEELRRAFADAMRAFAHYLNLTLPDPRALPYADDFKKLANVQHAAYIRYRDRRLDTRRYVRKLQELVQEAVRVSGLEVAEPVPLLSEAFEQQVDTIPSEAGKVRALATAIREKIEAQWEDDPVFYRSLHEELEHLLGEFRRRGELAKELAEKLRSLRHKIIGRAQEAEQLGLSEKALPFYHLLQKEPSMGKEELVTWAKELTQVLEAKVTRDWVEMFEKVAEVRTAIARFLQERGLQRERRRQLVEECLELAKRHFAGHTEGR